MIIVSQDGEQIFNFNTISRIDITVGTDPVSFMVNCETNTFREMLGEYKTQERAQEILKEITREFKRVLRTDNRGTGQVRFYDVPKVYYMPKE